VDSDWRLAYHLLKTAGYTLPWIETLKEIDADVEVTARICAAPGSTAPPAWQTEFRFAGRC